MLVPKTKREEI